MITFDPDIVLDSGDALADLHTAYVLSLLGRRRATIGEDLIEPTELNGWWGDSYADTPGDEWGSHLWTLVGKGMPNALEKAPDMVKAALAWAIEDRWVLDNIVSVESPQPGVLAIHVQGVLPSGEVVDILSPWYTAV